MDRKADVTTARHEETGFRLSWGAILAGLLVATAVQIILSLLGIAIGLGAIQFGPGAEFGEFGMGAGLWAIGSALASLFVGGLTAGHLAGHLTRFDGMLHGALVWGLSLVLTLWMIGAGVGTVLGGVFGVAGQTLSAAVSGATGMGAAMLQTDDGMPMMGGQAPESREDLVAAIEQRTELNRQQAEGAADAIIDTRRQFRLGAEEFRREAPRAARQAAGAISTAAWWGLLAAVLSLAAAVLGAAFTAEH